MRKLTSLTKNIRSKNAGPFWITIDIFFKNKTNFIYVSENLKNEKISNILQIDPFKLKRFDIKDLNVIKFSFPRVNIQGSRLDRDMHGASFSTLFEQIVI